MKVRRYKEEEYWGRPVPGFGAPAPRMLIVGLAPAAHGGNRTGRMFTGDRSGEWLFEALYQFGFANRPDSTHREDGMRLTDCYITAAVHCAPPGNKPLKQEYDNCRPYLLEELRMLESILVVVALGKIAFDAYLKAYKVLSHLVLSPIPQFGHGTIYSFPSGVCLIGSYHPSQQNTFTGRLTRPMFHEVFQLARDVLNKDG